jgi:hypothetical protein
VAVTHSCTGNTVGSVLIGSVQTSPSRSFKSSLQNRGTGGVPFSLILDLGAKVSILARTFYDSYLASFVRLQPADVVLLAYI